MQINFEQIEKLTGLHFDSTEQLYFYVLHHLEYLKTHNKNYTKKQYNNINDLFDIIHSIEF